MLDFLEVLFDWVDLEAGQEAYKMVFLSKYTS